MLAYLLQGLVLGATAAAQPGPFQAFLLSLVSRDGWRRALPAAFAPLISDGPIVLFVLLALTRMPGWILSALRVAGGLFLLYLAWGAWRAFRASTAVGAIDSTKSDPEPAGRSILKAALMNLLSPSPYIFWATITGPILIEAWRTAPSLGLAFLLGFYVALIGGLALFILVAGLTGSIGPRVNRGLGLFSAVVLFAFGIFQLAAGFRELLG